MLESDVRLTHFRASSEETTPGTYRRFLHIAAGVWLFCLAVFILIILVVDPLGQWRRPGEGIGAVPSANMRFMLRRIIDARSFDGIILGTSTARKIDPVRLGAPLRATLVNGAVHAASADDQIKIFRFFRRRHPGAGMIVWFIDPFVWCRSMPTGAGRSFPDWLYDEDWRNDVTHALNRALLEQALMAAYRGLLGRGGVLNAFGFGEPDLLDAAWTETGAQSTIDKLLTKREALDEPWYRAELAAGAPMANLDALRHALTALPMASVVALVIPPVHAASDPAPGSPRAAIGALCRERLGAIARDRGAVFLDFTRPPERIASSTIAFWDLIHYRDGVANVLAERVGTVLAALPAAH